jgi:SAM-dependent methyltransferase
MNPPTVATIYHEDEYPAMSHPPGHPSVIAATALLGGLRLPPAAQLRILEIGCSTGHHILPIAKAYPLAQITAIDFSAPAITEAKRLSALAGITNVNFIHADLLQWNAPKEAFDCIIAHGFFSWVNDQVKSALLALCQGSLSKNGVAMISYNTQPGWALRQPLREMANTLRQLDRNDSSALGAMLWIEKALDQRDDVYGRHLLEIVQDAKAKGEQQLKFDDLGPVNDPCYFSQFVHWCEQSQLTYLGEADSTLAQVTLLGNAAQSQLRTLANNPLLHEQMTDFLTGRTFRCSVICRSDAERHTPTPEELATLCIEALMDIPHTGNAATDALAAAITTASPNCLSLTDLLENASTISLQEAIPIVMRMAQLGMIRLRREPIRLNEEMPSHPQLSALNLDHLKHQKPIVDAFHRPCQLSLTDRACLQQCDGSISFEQLIEGVDNPAQVDALHALLAHIHGRGLFLTEK